MLPYVKDSIIFLFSNYHIEKLKGYFFAKLVMPAVYFIVCFHLQNVSIDMQL